jgi:hypothetical protein
MCVGRWVLRRRKARSRKSGGFECGREGRGGVIREQRWCRAGLKRRGANDAVRAGMGLQTMVGGGIRLGFGMRVRGAGTHDVIGRGDGLCVRYQRRWTRRSLHGLAARRGVLGAITLGEGTDV